MTISKFITVALSTALTTQAMKIGVISDFHLSPDYSPTASVDDNCTGSSNSVSADDIAPIGRINCDPSPALVDFMFQRFSELFDDVDAIIMTGDFIVHHLSPHHDEAVESGTWEKVKDIIDQSTALVEKHFPDKMVLFSIGNNDGWHSQAPDEGQKATLYGYLHDLWFENYPGNREIADSVKDTFMSAGYYRADLSPTVSVLSLNYEYMDNDDDTSFQLDEANEQLDWLEQQLILGRDESRKFILAGHVYAGVRYKAQQLWHENFAARYFQILRDHYDQVIIEVGGHDHYADLRYHSSYNVLDMKDTDTKFDFHNILVAPGVTPNKGNNPGVAMFEVNEHGRAYNLNMEFMDLVPQLGQSSIEYSDIKFLSLPFSDYGVTELSPDALSDFRNALEADKDMTLEYLVRKMGFDHNDETETQMAYAVYEDKDLITTGKQKTGEFLCLMHKSLSPDEYNDCCESANFAESMLEGADQFLQ